MTILGIPDVVVGEPVDVDLQLTTLDIHIGNEELYDKPSYITADLNTI